MRIRLLDDVPVLDLKKGQEFEARRATVCEHRHGGPVWYAKINDQGLVVGILGDEAREVHEPIENPPTESTGSELRDLSAQRSYKPNGSRSVSEGSQQD